MAIKHYTLTMIDHLTNTGRMGFWAEDDGSHTTAKAIAAVIAANSEAGIVSFKASEGIEIGLTEPTASSTSVNQRSKYRYPVVVNGQKSGLTISIPDTKITVVSPTNPIIRGVADPLSIYTGLRSEEGNTPGGIIDWAKFVYKPVKAK